LTRKAAGAYSLPGTDGRAAVRFASKMAQTQQTPEEPKTPMWLPALGVALFLGVGIWWANRPADPPPPAPDSGVVETAAGDAGPG